MSFNVFFILFAVLKRLFHTLLQHQPHAYSYRIDRLLVREDERLTSLSYRPGRGKGVGARVGDEWNYVTRQNWAKHVPPSPLMTLKCWGWRPPSGKACFRPVH